MSRQEWADGFRVLADFLDNNEIHGVTYPDQALRMSLEVNTAADVRATADQFAAGVKQSTDDDGAEHTSATFHFGQNAVELNIFHIEHGGKP